MWIVDPFSDRMIANATGAVSLILKRKENNGNRKEFIAQYKMFDVEPYLWALFNSTPLNPPHTIFQLLMSRYLTIALLLGQSLAYDTILGFNSRPLVETRSLDEIYHAALKEGGIVTVWHGGDEKDQQETLKSTFEDRFPGMTLNITVDLSKYLDGKIDQQLYNNDVSVDSIILQTLQDFPRWQQEGALLNYAPVGFDKVYPAFKDSISASWYGYSIFFWSISWNTEKLPNVKNISSYSNFLEPEFKNKLVLTYPNDDDAVLFAFYQM